MNIVVLDGYTLNPGDLSWKDLEALGTLTVYDKTAAGSVSGRAKEAEIVLTNKTVLTREIIETLPKLRYIGVLATGFNTVDIEAARERGIPVCNIPAYSTDSVAQLVFAFILEMAMQTAAHDADVKAGGWCRCEHFCYRVAPITELKGKTLGIIGFGNIGRKTAEIGAAFGMEIVYANRSPKTADSPLLKNARQLPLENLLACADFVSLNVPQNEATARMVNRGFLAGMKPGARLINTGRGGLVDEAAVAEALRSGRLGGYAADVLSDEPPAPGNPLLSAPNTLITPHIAWQSTEARQRLMDIAVANVRAFLSGRPQNRVG